MLIEEKLQTKVTNECDVLVAGGGFAGVAAALAAARNGADVMLLEREYMLGGLGTAGLIVIYLPLCDGNGRQVSFGLAEELLRLSVKYGGYSEYPKAWLDNGTPEEKKSGQRFYVRFNPHLCAIALEEQLIKEGVRIVYGTTVCGIDMSRDGKIKHIIAENKSGRSAVKVKSVVDATGDADIAVLSGVDTVTNDRLNSLAAWYYCCDGKSAGLKILGASDMPADGSEIDCNTMFTAMSAEELTEMTISSHKCILNDYLKKQSENPDYKIVTMPIIPQVRKTRKIVGKCELGIGKTVGFDDSVGMIGDWRKPGPVYEIPFGSLYSKKVKNLIMAGRCISVDDEMWEITRVIPACGVTGEAAGTAAAMSDCFDEWDISQLQKSLEKQGVVLHL